MVGVRAQLARCRCSYAARRRKTDDEAAICAALDTVVCLEPAICVPPLPPDVSRRWYVLKIARFVYHTDCDCLLPVTWLAIEACLA